MTNNQIIANTILDQLGGNKFLAMTGAYHLFACENGLSMKIRPNMSKANYMKIKLNGLDTYDVEFAAIRKTKMETKQKFNNVYFDQLRDLFTDVTGYCLVLR